MEETTPVVYRPAHIIAQRRAPEPEALAVADGLVRAVGDLSAAAVPRIEDLLARVAAEAAVAGQLAGRAAARPDTRSARRTSAAPGSTEQEAPCIGSIPHRTR